MSHFTYSTPNLTQLKQGDILQKSEEIKKILENVHPHYLKEDYKYFIILTQTCDLVKRGEKPCKSRYISIAAVRPLELLIEREIKKEQRNLLEKKGRFLDISKRYKFIQFLERLLNNNESDYFYLHEDTAMQFPDSCVAFLRLSVALKAELHYDNCLKAKILELKEVFQAKLGWLVGNMYSRIGTEDWVPETDTKEEFKKRIEKVLDKNCIWVENIDELLIELLKKYDHQQIAQFNEMELIRLIEQISIPSKKERVITRLEEIFQESGYIGDLDDIRKISMQIKNDPQISALLAR